MNDAAGPKRRAVLALHAAFGQLPPVVRRLLVRWGSPSYTLGAVVALQHGDRTLVLRQAHRADWSLPGGLLGHGETPEAAVAREVWEELHLRLQPGRCVLTRVDPRLRRVDLVYRVSVTEPPAVTPHAESTRAQWLTLPELLTAAAASETTVEILQDLEQVGRSGREGQLMADRGRP
ncbi:MAG: NUDIX hydrolase [Actinomycetales bacterium]